MFNGFLQMINQNNFKHHYRKMDIKFVQKKNEEIKEESRRRKRRSTEILFSYRLFIIQTPFDRSFVVVIDSKMLGQARQEEGGWQ